MNLSTVLTLLFSPTAMFGDPATLAPVFPRVVPPLRLMRLSTWLSAVSLLAGLIVFAISFVLPLQLPAWLFLLLGLVYYALRWVMLARSMRLLTGSMGSLLEPVMTGAEGAPQDIEALTQQLLAQLSQYESEQE